MKKKSVRLEFTEAELRRIKKKADKCRQPRKLYMESVVVRSVTGEGLE
jgi:predicted DNA binding CopG/RHH family protein